MKNTASFASQLLHRSGAAALLLSLITALPVAHAGGGYTLDANPNVRLPSSEIASVGQVISLADGHMLIVGMSAYLNGLNFPQRGIVRVDSSGKLDPTFVAPAGHTITGAAVASNGTIWALGDFNGTTGVSDSIVKLTADGALVPGFTPISASPGDRVVALPDNGVYVIDTYSGVANAYRFGADGQPAPGFTPVMTNSYAFFAGASAAGQIALTTNMAGPASVLVYDVTGAALPNATAGIPANFQVTGVAFDNQGAMVLSGVNYPGTGPMLIRILSSGVRDAAFDGTVPVTGPFSDGVVALADGSFAAYMRSGWGYPPQVLEFSASGVLKKFLPVSFTPSGSAYVAAVWSLNSGGYLISGNFDHVAGVPAPRLAKVTSASVVDSGFQALFESVGQVNALAQTTGGVLVGGYFTRVNESAAGNLALLTDQNGIDTSFPYLRWGTNSIVPLTDGGTLVMGNFEALPGTGTAGLAKLRGDRSVDTNFLNGVSLTGSFQSAVPLPGGGALIGGLFGGYPGAAASYLVKVTAAGTIDPTFNTNLSLSGGWSPGITAVAIHPSGGYLVGGAFTEFQGASRPALARITADGQLDPTFVPPLGMSPYIAPKNITVLADGRFYVVGALSDAVEWWMTKLYRFNADGTLDTAFTTPFDYVQTYVVANNGDLYVSGSYTSAASTNAPNLVRLSSSGAVDPTFSFSVNGPLLALLIDAKNRLVLGGGFTSIDGQPRESLARLVPLPLSVTIAGPANLTVPKHSTVTLSANVQGAAGAVSYQWYHDCEKIKNATVSSLTLTHVVKKDGGKYTVVVKASGETAQSAAVNVTVAQH